MKLKVIVLALAAAVFAASAAYAAKPAPHAHPHPTTGPGCKPNITLVLKGSVAVAPGATPVLPFGLMVTVKHASRGGKAYVKAIQPVTITVTSSTKVGRDGSATLASLLLGDRVVVTARACKHDLAHGATPALTATRVTAHAAHH